MKEKGKKKQLLKNNECKSGICAHKTDQFPNNLKWNKKMQWYMKKKLELEKLKLGHRTWDFINV